MHLGGGDPRKLRDIYHLSIGLSPLPVTVTTRIITCLVGDPHKPSFATATGRGDNPIYLLQVRIMSLTNLFVEASWKARDIANPSFFWVHKPRDKCFSTFWTSKWLEFDEIPWAKFKRSQECMWILRVFLMDFDYICNLIFHLPKVYLQ